MAAAVLGSLGSSAWAGELITLRNGFEMHCDHHAEIEGQVRLYPSTGENNYIQFLPQEIAGVEYVADPPPAADNQATRTVDPANPVLASLVKAESGGNTRAVSRAGARGLMQLMPGTASELGVQDSFRPDENVRAGSAYLDALMVRYHDKLALALAAYNAGPAAVDKYHGIPPYHETQAYVARVIHEFNRRVLAREALARQTVASFGAHPASGTR